MARPGSSGGVYDYAQLEGLWISAGGPPRLAPRMAAVAMAESGGRSSAQNPSGAAGLWQILGAPAGMPSSSDWLDPQVNARAAVLKWRQQGMGAWTTWTSGAWRRYFRRGVQPQDPSGGLTARVGVPYRNPLRGVSGLTAERVDMGVDYSGSGPVYALGPGRITYAGTGNTGWGPPAGESPGGYIKERITAGPLAGRSIYVAEAVTPSVRVGQRVDSGTVIGRMSGGIETGFAAPGPGTAALGASEFSGSNATGYGEAYNKILAATGAPAGTGGANPTGGLPSWLDNALKSMSLGFDAASGAGSGVAGAISGLGGSLGSIAQFFSDIDHAAIWLINPTNQVRIICGIGGGILVLAGIFAFAHVGEQSVSALPGGGALATAARPMSLPVGIGLVTAGAILLFIAFHNLPGSPANLPELLGSVRDQAQATAAK